MDGRNKGIERRMMNKNIYKLCNVELKADADERIITGYASTKDIDRQGDIVEPKAFNDTMTEFMSNPVLQYGHNYGGLPIGKIVEYEVKRKGLWIKAKISDTADDIWDLVKEGILKGISIGFRIVDSVDVEQEKEIIRKIRKLDLFEISIVNVPANAAALIESAKGLGIELKSINLDPKIQGKLFNEPTGLTRKEIKMETTEEMKKLQTDVADLREKIGSADEAHKMLADVQTSIKGLVKESDLVELKEKAQVDLLAATEKLHEEIEQKWVKPPKAAFDVASVEQAKRLGMTKNLDNPQVFKSMLINENFDNAAHSVGLGDQKHLLKELQDASDNLMTVGAYLGLSKVDHTGELAWVQNPAKLKVYDRYKKLLDIHLKALDTATAGEGYEWLPTGMSAILQEGLELERGLAKRLPRFSQPTKSYVWPLLTSDCTAYIVSEAISDANANTIAASTPGTSNITFTANGMGAGVWTSNEEIEDSIIAILPFMKKTLMKALINGEENALINGDNATTHQDTDVAALGASDIRKIFDGLRFDALNTSGANYDISTTLTYAKLLTTLSYAGKYGMIPGRGFFITSVLGYFKILGLSEFTGYSNFFVNMVAAKGALPNAIGHDIVPSAYSREVLDPNGVNGASDNIHNAIIFVNPDGWMIGDRRIYTVEQANYMWTQQKAVVATQRIDFQKMVPSTDTPTSIGYNIHN
jgi:HK97 family phage prohead protease/HK97 family phage major capsid protein